jgi:hypothetical protein
MSFKKNRSGVPYLKNEMPRVLLSGETDATTLQEKEECLQAFRNSAEVVLGRHHKAFLGIFKQMMVGMFGPGMEQVFNRVSPQGYYAEIGEYQERLLRGPLGLLGLGCTTQDNVKHKASGGLVLD